MKERCFDCLDVFEEEELEYCMCSDFMPPKEKSIPTKSGVIIELIKPMYCKKCIALKHNHSGESFI